VAIRREYGPRFRLAQALRRRASFEPARRAVDMLAEALELAESTPRRPVTVRVLASYGAALRRVERIPEAREALYRAVDMAGEMGMERLRDRAHQELVLAGGRPRRVRATGPQSLTAAQQQVARLAAAGRTNRQIAEDLFVTIKTVETHLAAVYRKLGIATRDALAEMLTAPLEEHPASATASSLS
jgi:DNA-binding CsgD family transcriptional regulator